MQLTLFFSCIILCILNVCSLVDPLHFLIIGDWGKGGSDGYTWNSFEDTRDSIDNNDRLVNNLRAIHDQAQDNKKNNNNKQPTNQAIIANAMAEYARSSYDNPAKFIVSVGDNFYTKGVQSATDSYWTALWTNIYLAYSSLNSLPWYPVVGNHDWGYGYTGIQAQLDRTTAFPQDQWQFPSTNYSRMIPIGDDATLLMLFLDTTTIAPNMNKCCNTNGGISVQVQEERIKNQLTRMEATLIQANQSSTPPNWIIVIGHYPIFSVGTNSGDGEELITYLLPLLIKYNVDAYICGHDHISAHLQFSGIDFFIVGAGSMTDSNAGSSAADVLWSAGGYSAFAAMKLTKTDLSIAYINGSVAKMYETTILSNKHYPTVEDDEPNSAPADDEYLPPLADDGIILPFPKKNQNTALTIGLVTGGISLGVILVLLALRLRLKNNRSQLRKVKDNKSFDEMRHLGSIRSNGKSSISRSDYQHRKSYSDIETPSSRPEQSVAYHRDTNQLLMLTSPGKYKLSSKNSSGYPATLPSRSLWTIDDDAVSIHSNTSSNFMNPIKFGSRRSSEKQLDNIARFVKLKKASVSNTHPIHNTIFVQNDSSSVNAVVDQISIFRSYAEVEEEGKW